MAKVRSAKGLQYRFRLLRLRGLAIVAAAAILLLSAGLAAPPRAGAGWGRATQVFVALLPNGTPVRALGAMPEIAPGLLSAGIGEVPAEQTYLDIGQGNRVSERLYDEPLPIADPNRADQPAWNEIVERADSVPADLVPGLLAESLRKADQPIAAEARLGSPALIAVDPHGQLVEATTALAAAVCPVAVCVLDVPPSGLRNLVRSLRGDDMLIVLERPPPEPDHQLTIGIAGRGFDGNLTSDSTRLRGYVLATDIAPTILERLGVPVPSEISGEAIRSDGGRDIGAVVSLEDRLSSIVGRRGSVIGISALIWIGLALLAIVASRGVLARPAVRIAALTAVYLPLVLLAGAALEPSEAVERLIVLVTAPLLAALTLTLLPGYRALAFACALTTLAFAIDVIAGSPLTRLSLLGPNPGLGVRFYGIGNELEAILVPLILVGTGAVITSLDPGIPRRRAAAVFLAVAFPLAFVFAAGRFGADVGFAIVLPAGAAAAVALLGAARRTVLLVIAAPLAALAALALGDLLLGGDAHLTRSVLDAGGLHDLGDVAERRLRLSADSFGRGVDAPLFWVAVGGIVLGLRFRARILAWLAPTPVLRAGFLATAFATLVAALVNDSGVLLLEVGTIYLLLFAGFAWAQAPTAAPGASDRRPARAQS